MKKVLFLSVFFLNLVRLPGLGVSEIRTYDILFFRGPIRMRLKNSGSFCVGQVPRMSHVATRPKNHVRDASVPRCHGLLQQAPPPVCWCCRRCRSVVLILASAPGPRCTVFFPSVLMFFFRLVLLKNTLEEIVCCRLLLLYFCISFVFTFLSPPKYMRQGRMHGDCIISKGSGAVYNILNIKVVMLLLMHSYTLVHSFKTESGRRHSSLRT